MWRSTRKVRGVVCDLLVFVLRVFLWGLCVCVYNNSNNNQCFFFPCFGNVRVMVYLLYIKKMGENGVYRLERVTKISTASEQSM